MSSSGDNNDELYLTLVLTSTGQSEYIPFSATQTTIQQVQELCQALFGLDGDASAIVLAKEGKPIAATASRSAAATTTLRAAGLGNGDLITVQQRRRTVQPQRAAAPVASPAPASAPAAAGSLLDFSNLFGGGGGNSAATAGGAGGGLDFSSLLPGSGGGGATSTANAAAVPPPPPPQYWASMNLDEAMQYNQHPRTFISLVFSKEHLYKEMNYHMPRIAERIKGKSLEEAAKIWQEELVRGSIVGAMKRTETYHKETEMKKRLQSNPDDGEAKEYFAAKERKKLVQQQYEQMMQEYPESLGRVLMLYIEAKINGHSIQMFCDSGAQSTIMSLKSAKECGLQDYVDTRFAGTAVGVGTGKILGRIHLVELKIDNYYFPCSVTVMDDPKDSGGSEMPFLLGLDMMKRHTCQIDLEKGCLKFRLEPGKYLEAPFLHEKDLDESKGGTKGFDANAANKRLKEELDKEEEEEEERAKKKDPKKDADGDTKMS